MTHSILRPASCRLACVLAIWSAASGCEALSPQQLWKLNRQPNMDRGDAYFSVPAETDFTGDEADLVTHLDAPPAMTSKAAGRPHGF
ncbi:hypothetical protein Pan44_09620 [Caulifigura coniformis]|uniref:Uncharacterized protein n=1 Tax=Caulifigura coniformis TaxID=2527983 RepID=A0A517S9Z5_9PLAN|nr:hypothetical protein [Caulifigura coniformis]QDT52948.1 hypothetical protein Pan44_09620 [Caulifigura coniformis]